MGKRTAVQQIKEDQRLVYFAGAIRGDRIAAETMRKIVLHIQSLGITVLTEHVVAEDPIATFAGKINKDKDSLLAIDIEQQDTAWLDEATHVVAEISGASTGTGREIEYARTKHLHGKVPAKVLCVYNIAREFYASPMIRGMTPARYPNVQVGSYSDIEEVISIVNKFLKK